MTIFLPALGYLGRGPGVGGRYGGGLGISTGGFFLGGGAVSGCSVAGRLSGCGWFINGRRMGAAGNYYIY